MTDFMIEEFKPPAVANGSELERKNALAYVNFVKENAAAAEIYLQKTGNERQALGTAFHDFIEPPKIMGILTEAYAKNANKPIVILASDDFEVRNIKVRIFDTGGRMLDNGSAKQFLQKNKWYYFPAAGVSACKSLLIEAKAFDRPGNQSTFTQQTDL